MDIVLGNPINETSLKLAVTGLSRAGKTVFITSLVQNLLAQGAGADVLPRFGQLLSRGGQNRLRDVSVEGAGSSSLPWFEFRRNLSALGSQSPAWPDRTNDIAQISLILKMDRESPLGKTIGERRIRLEILDYPGEWLLDLPLLKQSFAAWSVSTLELMRQPPRHEVAERFISFSRNLLPADKVTDELVREGHEHYKSYLESCRSQYGLRYLQPGRFLCPGPRGDVPLLWFFPMAPGLGAPPKGDSLWTLLSDRFESYKREIRREFFDTHFRSFNRQVVLTDVLGALCAGKAAFDDTARALQEINAELSYGGRTWFLGPRRISRLVYAATKADHVPAVTRDNLRHLLRALTRESEDRPVAAGVRTTYRCVASVYCTEDGSADHDGRSLPVVLGRVLGEDRVRPFFVGTVPAGLPSADFWLRPYFELPKFRPPPFDTADHKGLPHLGIDEILEDLLGDLV